MQPSVNSPGVNDKANLRDEITDQIREFLQRGGKIEVVEDKPNRPGSPVGSIWSGVDREIDLSN